MDAEPFLERILDDEGLRGDLDDPAATLLIDWLTTRVRGLVAAASSESAAAKAVNALARRGRAISRFVTLWCGQAEPEAMQTFQHQQGVAWSLPASTEREQLAVLRHILKQED